MRYAIVVNNKVVNVCEGTEAWASAVGAAAVMTETGNIGDYYDPASKTFLPPATPKNLLQKIFGVFGV